ncbi:unnamed protein product [Brassica oleracea var. botrytis]|uniref:(rape) hypothetical protein n=1 Tax=Brassica napus TaxID=3708 RepID=A0A816JL80_BRANA|nr:unnamed protein product [Brassica napus]
MEGHRQFMHAAGLGCTGTPSWCRLTYRVRRGDGDVSGTPRKQEPPLWNYVTKLEKLGATGGTWRFKCSFCDEIRQGSYSRVKAHLLALKGQGISICRRATMADKLEMQKLENEFELKKSESGCRAVPLPCESLSKKRKSCISPIVASFGIQARDQLDQEIARMFFTGGVPFNLVRKPSYHRSYQFAAASKLDGYVPPSYNKLRTTLLQQEKNNVEKLLVPLKSTWKEKGVTIVSDGWSDPVRKPLINFLATSGSGPMFLKAENCFGEVKDKFFITKLLEEVIHQVGDQNVVQVITDNAPNCKAAGDLIEGRCPCNKKLHHEPHHETSNFWGLQAMVISEEWSTYRDDDIGKASFVKEKIVDDDWWEKMWDSMIEKVKAEIYKREKRSMSEFSPFYNVVYEILVARWTKNNTPLHCLAHSLNPSDDWLNEDLARKGPHRDAEISHERIKCFRRLFPSNEDHMKVMQEYALFSMKSGPFEDLTSISMMTTMDPKSWWTNFGAQTPLIQTLAFKLLGQPSSSSCAERNWSTYSFIHSLRWNRLNPSRAQDLVFIHNNLRLLSRNSDQYEAEKTKTWDVGGDGFDSMEDVGFLEFADLSLDEPDFENELLDD